VYVVLSVCYKFYLQFSDGSLYYPDYLTNLVGRQSEAVLDTMGYNAAIAPHPKEASLKLLVRDSCKCYHFVCVLHHSVFRAF